MEEIIELVHAEIITSGYASRLAGGLVITGGGSQLAYVKQLFEYMTGMDARIGYPNEHLGKSKVEVVKSPMYATTVGLVLSGFRALDERENRYMENQVATGKKTMKSAKKSSDFFKGLIDKTKGLLMDDFSDKNDY
ncbi:MAG: cell division protein FtsA [Roseivirga sp.]|jgi:cell division protein FtsA